MTRFATKLAVGTAVLTLAAAPALASAQTGGVDQKTGPVSFANPASFEIAPKNVEKPGRVITETQQSPTSAGESVLKPGTRAALPKDGAKDEQDVLKKWTLNLGPGPQPAGIPSRDPSAVAKLAENNVPSAATESNYSLMDSTRGGGLENQAVLAFQGARTQVNCAGTNALTSQIGADKLFIRGGTDVKAAPASAPTGATTSSAGPTASAKSTTSATPSAKSTSTSTPSASASSDVAPADTSKLEEVKLPEGNAKLERKDIRFGGPKEVPNADPTRSTSDLTVSRLTAFDSLLRQDLWRGGDFTTAAGWLVEIVSHVRDKAGKDLDEVRSKLVIGGVSCSLPTGFVPKQTNASTGGGKRSVPVRIPAGANQPVLAESAPTNTVLGYSLVGGGVLALAGAALFVARRRRALAESTNAD